jgi:hypothetical protein
VGGGRADKLATGAPIGGPRGGGGTEAAPVPVLPQRASQNAAHAGLSTEHKPLAAGNQMHLGETCNKQHDQRPVLCPVAWQWQAAHGLLGLGCRGCLCLLQHGVTQQAQALAPAPGASARAGLRGFKAKAKAMGPGMGSGPGRGGGRRGGPEQAPFDV